jgi:hypothetical protein
MSLRTEEDDKQNSDLFRPYTSFMTEHDYDLASIIIFNKSRVNNSTNVIISSDGNKSGKSTVPAASKGTDFLSYNPNPIKKVSTVLEGSVATSSSGTYAGADDISSSDVALLNLDGTSPYYGIFNNFSIMNFNESRDDVVKVNMNFGGSWNAFFFGERPRIITMAGMFLDSKEYPYYQEFMVAYNKYLSGRKCIENGMQLTMSFNGKIIKGHILKIDTSGDADLMLRKLFSLTILIETDDWFRSNLNPSTGTTSLNLLSNEKRYDQLAVSQKQQLSSVADKSTIKTNEIGEERAFV